MELRQIRYFLAVADTLHFGKAAEKLHMAEQPLSYQIKKLEQELGFQLFERTTRSVRLTPAGEAFREKAALAVDTLERGVAVAAKTAAGERGKLVVSYGSSSIHGVLPLCIRAFKEAYPEIELELIEQGRPDLDRSIADVRDGVVDLDVSILYDRQPEGVAIEVVESDPVMMALPVGHRLAQEEGVRLADLREERFLNYAPDSNEHAFIERLCCSAGFMPIVAQEAETYLSLLGLVASGMGMTMAMSSLQSLFPEQIAYRPLVEPRMATKTALLYRAEDAPPAALRFVETARMVAKREAARSS